MDVLPYVAFISGPYRDHRGTWWVRENIRSAEKVALECWRQGLPAICPHLNTAMWDGAAPDDLWLKGDLLILERCDLVVLVTGWERSTGAWAEAEYAESLGKPVVQYGQGGLTSWIRTKREEHGLVG